MSHDTVIQSFPLQTYISALLFSPRCSLIRDLYTQDAPNFVTILPSIQCSHHLSTRERHREMVYSVAFSHDSTRVVSVALDDTTKIWDAGSGVCLQTLEGNSDFITDMRTFDQTTSQVKEPGHLEYSSERLTSDGAWIKHRLTKVWLPREYRKSCSAVSADTIAIGTNFGNVWLCSFNTTNT